MRRREAREDEQAAIQPDVEGLSTTVVVDAAFKLHRDLGPRLLDSVDAAIMTSGLRAFA